MKRIFTLLILVVSVLSGFSQAGSIYRFVGNNNATPANWTASTAITAGTRIVANGNVYQCDISGTTGATSATLTGMVFNTLNGTARFDYFSSLAQYIGGADQNDLGYWGTDITGNGNTGSGFRNPSFWRLVTGGVVGSTPVTPASGATLQFFGRGINIEADVNLTAYDFTIQIRSEYNASIPTTNMALGFIYVDNSDDLIISASSNITLGWGTAGGTNWAPGYLMLTRSGGNDARIVRVATTIATTGGVNGGSYLHARGYEVSSNVHASIAIATAQPASSHILPLASAPTGNLPSRSTLMSPAPTFYFTNFQYFYNQSGASLPNPVAPLPLQLGSFSAQKGTGKVSLNWSTVLEVNTSHFEVEQSNNGSTWKTISIVAAKGNSNSAQKYAADDIANYSSKVYYRLKMVDIDGKFEYSPIAVVTFGGKGKLFAYPNPAASFTMVSSDKAITENVTVSIFNTTGVLVKQQVITNPGNNFRVGLEDLKQGTYLLKINQGAELLEVIKIQKN